MSDAQTAPALLRRRIGEGDIVVAVGAYDGLSARLAEDAGFEAVYASGGAIARSAGLPDLGLLSMSEMVERVHEITQAVRVPVIADADTGYGNALNVRRTVRLYEEAGVAALHLEDQITPKRCGHYEGQEVISAEEMVEKIRAAVEARIDPHLVVIARTGSGVDNVAIDEASLRAAARLYVAEALLHGTTTLVDHHESPRLIEGSLDVLADACHELGARALLCYGATERNGGRDEASRGLTECRRFIETNSRPLVRGVVGLHASFTVSDETLREAAALCRELDSVVHVHLAEDRADVEDAAYVTDELAADVLHRLEGWGEAYVYRDGKMWLPQSLAVDILLRYGGALQRLLQ